MKIRDFIKLDIDIDVCDDYDERCYIAFVGPLELTEAGAEDFADVLNLTVEINDDETLGILHADSPEEADGLREFFYSAAGYCSDQAWHIWFEEPDFD